MFSTNSETSLLPIINFLIDSTKFEEVFDFEFKETPTTIVQSIVEQFDKINKGNRSDAKLY